MQNIPLHVLVNFLFGFFSIITACLVLFYRKKFTLHNGIAILFLSEGIAATSVSIMSISDMSVLYKFYFLSRSLVPIFLLLFSEYILKINYHIIVKLLSLIPTCVLGSISFFQKNMDNSIFLNTSDIFLILTILTIIIHLLAAFFSSKDRLMRRYLLIFLSTLAIVLTNEVLNKIIDIPYNLYSTGISAMILTHGIIVIITSGGYGLLGQKFPKLMYIILVSLILDGSLKLLFPDIPNQYLRSLFVVSIIVLSCYYMFGEVIKNPREIRQAFLISKLLSSPINDRKSFIGELRQWEEIDELHFIIHSDVEGNSSNLNLLFQKTGRVIHKFQIPELMKALEYNPNFVSGIEVAQYYFKKMDCSSLFQLSDKGDFLAIKYVTGLNPALYTNELSVMSKIVFSISNAQNN